MPRDNYCCRQGFYSRVCLMLTFMGMGMVQPTYKVIHSVQKMHTKKMGWAIDVLFYF
jgi:hypothetical protein